MADGETVDHQHSSQTRKMMDLCLTVRSSKLQMWLRKRKIGAKHAEQSAILAQFLLPI